MPTASKSKSSARRKTSARASTKSRSTARSSTTARKSTGASSRAKSSRSQGKTTIDHDEIREWVESRGGSPATVTGTERKSETAGLLRIDFPGYSGTGTLEHLEWDEFFEKFDEAGLAFLYDDKKGSRFNKFIARQGKRF